MPVPLGLEVDPEAEGDAGIVFDDEDAARRRGIVAIRIALALIHDRDPSISICSLSGGRKARAGRTQAGKTMLNLLPLPGLLSTTMRP